MARDGTFDVAIIGGGLAGIGAAVRLTQAGRTDFVVLEQGDALGGTWRDNTYPGCACDVESFLYSFSFAPNPNWSRHFARQPEIRRYLDDVADRYGLRDRLRLGTAVTSAQWENAARDGGAGWIVRTAAGEAVRARVVVWATGALHEPSIPDIDGLDGFAGTAFHSARWNHDHDLRGRRVAVIGTGASAIQFVPRIQPVVGALTLFQRSAPWVLPKVDHPIPARRRRRYAAHPTLQKLRRAAVYARNESLVGGFLKPGRMRLIERVARAHLDRALTGRPDLAAKLAPDFVIGCKRLLLSSAYYPALTRPNVDVVTERITRVTSTAVVTADGAEHAVDTIIFGTGFRVAAGLGQTVPIIGAGGIRLGDEGSGIEAFLGTTISGFPNLFVLTGPNTGLGHTSMIYMIESQLNYVLDALALLDERGAVALDTRRDRQDGHNADLQRRLAGSVWNSGGCRSWYLDAAGRNHTIWPDYTFRFRRRTRRVDPADHRFS